jgi:molecular chaperone DnaK (HSP70)
LDFKDIQEIFRGTLEDCSHVVEKFFHQLEKKKIKIDKILLVGGFGSCKIFQNHIKENFGERVSKVLVPENPAAAVLLGAVYYGKNKKLIKSRVLRRTYGVGAYSNFKPGIHKEEKKVDQFLNSGKFLCKDIFDIWARAGEEIEGEKKISKNYSVVSHDQKVIKFEIYSTSELDPMYVDEFEDTQMDLSFSIDIEKSFTSNEVKFDIFFGSTEVRIDVSHNGKKFEKKFLLK